VGPVILLAITSVVGATLLLLASRLSVQRWVRWARDAADYGASDILNARHIDSERAVSELRAQFDAWSTIVKEGTAEFCRTIDAHRIQFFDAPAAPDFRAYNDEHRYIRHMTAMRIERLLDLASRVEKGETRLRAYFVPRAQTT
jgi:hypothetical protein